MTRKTAPPIPLYEAKWTAARRKAYYKAHPENFAGPNMTYPIEDTSDVADAWGLAGHAADPAAVRTKIIAIAKRLGFAHALPDTAKAAAKENVQIAATNAHFVPRQRIATLTTCFLEDDAVSLNGRQYPPEAVDRLVQSAQIALADSNHPPLTCYISHGSADSDNTLELVGKITRVWKEGTRAYATIDVPGTRAGEDVATLASGGYIKTQSLRASNARLYTDKHKAYPQVGGESLQLDGIDFTTTPGLPDVARINNVLLESQEGLAEYERLAEFFNIPQHTIALAEDEGEPMTDKLKEGAQAPASTPISGDSPALDGTASQGSYGSRMYQAPQLDTPGPMQGMEHSAGLMEAHDRIATVMEMACAPSRESARGRLVTESLRKNPLAEAGKRLSASTRGHLAVAHDGVAKALGMECAEGGKSAANSMDGDYDGDGNDDRLIAKENARMKNEEALSLLEAQGYQIAPPKSAEQVLEEKLAEQARALEARFEERLRTITAPPSAAPQRKSLVSGANADTAMPNRAKPYMHGSYLKERMNGLSWQELADRTHPLPADLNFEFLLKEFEQLYAVQYDDRFGTTPIGA